MFLLSVDIVLKVLYAIKVFGYHLWNNLAEQEAVVKEILEDILVVCKNRMVHGDEAIDVTDTFEAGLKNIT